MRIIFKDPTLILTAVVGLIFSIAMITLLSQMISETENIKKSWNEMSCQELNDFLRGEEYNRLNREESDNFEMALEFCKGQ